MTSSRRFGLCLTLALALPALSQTLPSNPNQPRRVASFGLIGNTVSVASLRISAKAWSHFNNAKDADKSGHDADFSREFDRALAIEPRFGALYLLRASREVRLRQFEAALADVLAAKRIEPGITSAGTILASVYNGLSRFSDALLVLNTLRGSEADTWQVAYELTRAYLGRGDAQEALRTSALTLKLAPEACHEAHLLRANAFSIARRQAEAIDQFRLFLASNPAPSIAAKVQQVIELLNKQPAPAPDSAIASN